MSNGDELEDYEIGYGKPPKSGQFKKGISGNPSGRRKKPSDFASELMKELQSKVAIHENGKRKAITESVGIKRQVVNKALSGNLMAARLVDDWIRQAKEMMAEQPQNSPNGSDIDPKPEEKAVTSQLAAITCPDSRLYGNLPGIAGPSG